MVSDTFSFPGGERAQLAGGSLAMVFFGLMDLGDFVPDPSDVAQKSVREGVEATIEAANKIPTIGGRRPINCEYAGKVHPSGIRFTDEGFPDFSPHAKAEVEIDGLTGNRGTDNQLANQAAGFGDSRSAPDGYTWHHVEDGRTMQLVPSDIHSSVRHTGGAAVIKNGGFD